MPEPIVFRHTVEAILDHVIRRLNLMSEAELRALNFERARDCDMSEYVKLSELAAARLAPGKSEDDAFELLGRELLRAYTLGLVGKTLLMVGKLLGPKRALLKGVPEGLNSTEKVRRANAVEKGPRHVEITIEKIPGARSAVFRGLISETLVLVGVERYTVTPTENAEQFIYNVTWE